MKCPPYAVAVRVAEEGRTKFRVWFPLILLWPLLLVLLLLTLVVSLAGDGASLLAGRRPAYTCLVVGGLGVVGETRGTELMIEKECRTVAVTVR